MSIKSIVAKIVTKPQVARFVRLVVIAVLAQAATGAPVTAAVVVAAVEVAFRGVFPV